MRKLGSLIAVVVLLALSTAGCKSNQPAPAPAQNSVPPGGQQGTLNADGTFTPSAQQPGQQPAQQTSQAPAPAPTTYPDTQRAATRPLEAPPRREERNPEPRQAPVSRPVERASRTVPVGTPILVQTTETLSASHNEVGDAFSGSLRDPVISDGSTLFTRGTRVTGTVVAAKGRGRFKGAGAIGIQVDSIGGVRVQTSEYEAEGKGKGKRTGVLVGGGAGLGALIGGLAGGGKGALIGGLAGAGAGTAGAAYTGNKDVVIPSESVITFRLVAPLTLTR